MAYPDVTINITDGGDANADEQDVLFGPVGANPPTDALLTNEPLSTTTATATDVEPGTYYAQRVVRNSSTGETASTTPIQISVLPPSVSINSPAGGASLEEGATQTIAAAVTANAHAGAGIANGISAVRFEYSTDGGTSWTEIDTAACDDTSSPVASVDWTVVSGANALRAVCVDPGNGELGSADSIGISVTAPAFSVDTVVHDWDLDDDLGSGITSGSLANDVGTPTLDIESDAVNSLATHIEMLSGSRLRSSANLTATDVSFQIDFDVRFPGSLPGSKTGLIELNPLLIAFNPLLDPDSIQVEGIGSNAVFVFSSGPAADTWYSVSIRYDAAGETLYGFIDGTESGSISRVATFSPSDRLYVAGFGGASSAFDMRNLIIAWE